MSFLTEAGQEDLANFLAGNNNSGEDNSEPAQERQELQNQSAAPSSPSASEEDEGHAVPYSRFKSVIQARNDLRARSEELESQLKGLQEQLNTTKQSKSSVSAFDELYGTFNDSLNAEPEDENSSKMKRFEQIAEKFEIQVAQQEIERDLAVAQSKYPDVPRDVLLTAVVQNPNADILDVAERYSTFVSSVREDAIAKYVGSNGRVQAAPPAVPPRVGSASVARQQTGFGDSPKPTNLTQAKDSMMDFLKQNGWR